MAPNAIPAALLPAGMPGRVAVSLFDEHDFNGWLGTSTNNAGDGLRRETVDSRLVHFENNGLADYLPAAHVRALPAACAAWGILARSGRRGGGDALRIFGDRLLFTRE